MVGAIKPATPKPVQILSAGILHGSEKVRWSGALKHPAPRVLLEGIIKLLATQHALAQNTQGQGGLGIGIVAGALEGIGPCHNWHFILLLQVTMQAALPLGHDSGGIILLPFLLSKKLHEGIQAFIHPHPLTFIRVHNHRKPIMPHLMDNNGNKPVLGAFGISAVLFRARALPAKHGVFHAPNGSIHGDRHRVGIIKGEL